MDEQLVRLLSDTHLPHAGPRMQAERELENANASPDFPIALLGIAINPEPAVEIRQSALTYLRKFIQRNWSPGSSEDDDDEDDQRPYYPISEAIKPRLRQAVLQLALSPEDERKVKVAASYVVSKIAMVDFPDQWPELLPEVLKVMPTGTDAQLHGALRILQDLVEESLTDEQFFGLARNIIGACLGVATDENRKQTHRALAVLVFRGCFDLMDIVQEDHKSEVKDFAGEILENWLPFFEMVIKGELPSEPMPAPNLQTSPSQPESWYGPIALKTQVVKTLIKIKGLFPMILLPKSLLFFEATWEDLTRLRPVYEALYIATDAQGKLEDIDGLPFTLDLLVLEELDLLNQCLRAPPVRETLQQQISQHAAAHQTPWMVSFMDLINHYSQIAQEEEGLWDIDVSLFLAEEATTTSNYTARTASGDLMIKLFEWLQVQAIEGLYAATKVVFDNPEADWRKREGFLYLLNCVLADLQDQRRLEFNPEIAAAYMVFVEQAIGDQYEPLLRARGFLVAGNLSIGYPNASSLLGRVLTVMVNDESEVVQVACIKALNGFIQSRISIEHQTPIIVALERFLEGKDLADLTDADDLISTLLDTLRAAINMDIRIAFSPHSRAVDLLFLFAKYGAANMHIGYMVDDTVEQILLGIRDSKEHKEMHAAFCARILPSVMGSFDVANITADDPLVTLATELLALLSKYGSEPLPPGFVAGTLPKLGHLLLSCTEGEVLRPGAEAVKYMLMHDHIQVFGWQDDQGRSGLELCLRIVDRLLGPDVEDNSASEVGGVAAELVEKAGQERLGPYLPQLLQAVATRLDTAQAPSLIQSLTQVFARLSLAGAHDVVEFLSSTQINGHVGLQVVLNKWLDSSINFAGYDEIRRNVIALSKIFSLNDARVAQTQVKGDLIIVNSGRIMTRSQAKLNPDQFTIIPAPLKILKVLVDELVSAAGTQAASAAAADALKHLEDDDGDDTWEDDTSDPANLANLQDWVENMNSRVGDDETQNYLTEFFLRAARENIADFKTWYDMLTEDEKGKLNEQAAKGQS